jgi:hypothetical protein
MNPLYTLTGALFYWMAVSVDTNQSESVYSHSEYLLHFPLFVFLVSYWLNFFLFLILNDGGVALGSWRMANVAFSALQWYKEKSATGNMIKELHYAPSYYSYI